MRRRPAIAHSESTVAPLDMDKIARGLGAERRGKVRSSGGYLGAMQIAMILQERTTNELSGSEAERLIRPTPRRRR
jgi:hypothetical protein